MARIRSIKPEFFTSETIAALPVTARLTFIGLWTYVDDNGVGQDNARLVTAAIWPLEDDPTATLRRTREDLARLHEARLITRYEQFGKRYLFVATWDEHQKISHPRKPRFPRPDEEGCEPVTSGDIPQSAPLAKDSGRSPETLASTPEILAPDQGAGIREQGVPTTSGREAPATTDALIGEWIEHCRRRPPGSVIGQVGKQIKAMLAEGVDSAEIRRGLAAWAQKGLHPSTLPSVVNDVMNAPTGNVVALRGEQRAPITDVRMASGRALKQKFQAMETSS